MASVSFRAVYANQVAIVGAGLLSAIPALTALKESSDSQASRVLGLAFVAASVGFGLILASLAKDGYGGVLVIPTVVYNLFAVATVGTVLSGRS